MGQEADNLVVKIIENEQGCIDEYPCIFSMKDDQMHDGEVEDNHCVGRGTFEIEEVQLWNCPS